MRHYKRIVICLLQLLLLFGGAVQVWAEDSEEKAPSKELETGTPEAIDAVLVLDSSGSMLLTDPQKLRYEGVRLFLQTLRPNDRLAIIEFSRDAKLVRPLSAVASDQASSVFSEISKIDPQGIYTDLLAGLNLAYSTLQEQQREEATQLIILLSDGKMEPDPAIGLAEFRTRELLDSVLPNLKAKEIKVHTLYFSELADKQLLAEIANGTNGLNWFTPSATTIHQSYTSLFLAVKKPQVVPLTKKGFRIDENIIEATFYLNREEGASIVLRAPGGSEINENTQDPNVKWFRGQKFDVVTIIKPEVGDWQVEGLVSQDTFATVLTDLKLVSDWSANIFSGSNTLLQARLYEANKPVVLPEMTGAAHYAFQISPTDKISEPIIRDFLVDDGTKGDKIASDGIFSREVKIDEPGEYKLSIVLQAPTFQRTQQIPFKAKPRFVSLSVYEPEEELDPIKEGKDAEHGEKESEAGKKPEPHDEKGKTKYFKVDLSPEAAAISKLDVTLLAIDADQKRFSIPLTRAPGKGISYLAPTTGLKKGVDFEVQAFVKGKDKRSTVNEVSNVLHFINAEELPTESEVELVAEPEAPKEEEKQPESIPWIPFALVVALINAGIGFALTQKLKSAQTGDAFVMPKFPESEEFARALQALEAKAALTEISLDDPILTGSAVTSVAPGIVSGQAVAQGAAAAEAVSQEADPAGGETPNPDGGLEQFPGDSQASSPDEEASEEEES